MEKLDLEVVGDNLGFWGPFGWKEYTYFDHTASGKSVHCIEKFIQQEVLPHYANTHTTVSYTSHQTTVFRDDARSTIKQSVGALPTDEVIFCGSGATSAVHKLLHCISYPKGRKLVVFVGPFEHHSNILPWREAASKVIQVPSNSSGKIDAKFLQTQLKKTSKWNNTTKKLIIGCFSAASNVTGALTDDVQITELMHAYGGLAFWDYAAAAPHVHINMNPNGSTESAKDAIFFSGHKFFGGPQTPGVLVVKKHILANPVPHGAGGGTVLFTTRKRHQYLQDVHEREEGGTPDIIGSIRLGLVFRLRNLIGVGEIVKREALYCRRMLMEWKNIPEVHILGSSTNPRMPCISFMIKHLETGYFLHHNFVVALLNDLFGIQCRGGCMCAGPYAQSLLGIDDKLASMYESYMQQTEFRKSTYGTVFKPGFVRLSLSFHSSLDQVNFVIEAVKIIARFGWKLLPFYETCWKSGSFKAHTNTVKPKRLQSFDIHAKNPSTKSNEDCPSSKFDYKECIEDARFVLTKMVKKLYSNSKFLYYRSEMIDSDKLNEPKLLKLRWFLTQNEALLLLQSNRNLVSCPIQSQMPFSPERSNQMETNYQWKIASVPHCISRAWKPQLDQCSELEFKTWTLFQRHNRLSCFPMSNSDSSGFQDDENWNWKIVNDNVFHAQSIY